MVTMRYDGEGRRVELVTRPNGGAATTRTPGEYWVKPPNNRPPFRWPRACLKTGVKRFVCVVAIATLAKAVQSCNEAENARDRRR